MPYLEINDWIFHKFYEKTTYKANIVVVLILSFFME